MPIRDWSTTPADNDSAPPFGAPEGHAPSATNNIQRQVMSDVRSAFESLPFFDFGHDPTRIDNDTFTVATDLTATYAAGRRVKLVGATTGYATIASSSYSAPDTTVNVTMDSGNVPTSLLTVALGPDSNSAQTPRYDITDAEIAAGVTPTNYGYAACDLRRYGGNPDGTTDSTAAVVSALLASAAGSGNIIVDGGTYRVASNTTIARGATIEFRQGGKITVDSGRTLTITGTLRAPRTQIFTGSGTVSLGYGGGSATQVYPEWWGAIPDGTTDCSQAIQKAINAAGGSVISFAAGVYSAEGFALNSASSLYGVSKDETIIKSRTSVRMCLLDNASGVLSCQLTVKDITFDGDNTGTIGLQINNCARFSIRDCKFTGFTVKAFYSHGSILYQMVRCEIKNSPIGYDADSDQSNTNAVALQDCSINGCVTHAIRVRRGSLVVVDTCDIEACGTAGSSSTRAIDLADMDPDGLGVSCVIKNAWMELNNGLAAILIGPPLSAYSKHIIEDTQIFAGTRTYGIAVSDGPPITGLHIYKTVAQNAASADIFVGTNCVGSMIDSRATTVSISATNTDFVMLSNPATGEYRLGNNLSLSAAGALNLPVLPTTTSYANDAAAAGAGVAIGQFYRNGSVVQCRIT